MKAENIMLGDFVYRYGNEVWKIEDVSKDGEVGISRMVEGSYETDRCDIETLEPIVITNDILKKNGIYGERKDCIQHFGSLCFRCYECNSPTDKNMFWHTELGICENDGGGNTYTILYFSNYVNVRYVHELQHLLKFNNLTKINNKFVV